MRLVDQMKTAHIEVKIIRSGKEVHSVDLYNYFIKGTLKNITLRDQM